MDATTVDPAPAPEWWRASDEELVAAWNRVEHARRRLDAELLALVGEADNRNLAGTAKYPTVALLQRDLLGISLTESKRRVDRARAVTPGRHLTGEETPAVLPTAGAALAAGEITVEHVDKIDGFRQKLSDEVTPEQWAGAEPILVELARTHDPVAVWRFAHRELGPALDPDGFLPTEKELAEPHNELHYTSLSTGWGRISGTLNPETFARFTAHIHAKSAPRPRTADGLDPRTTAQRRGDAFCEYIDFDHTTLPLPADGGERPRLTVTIRWEDLQNELGTALLGPNLLPVSVSEARRLACDCQIIPLVLGADSLPLDVGRASRTIPPHIRRAVVNRDRGCTFPGCDRPASHCQVHHVIEWCHGGPTRTENLALLCDQHHRLVHHSDWEVRMTSGRPEYLPPTFIDPERTPVRNRTHQPLE